jgi:hypothetical protein
VRGGLRFRQRGGNAIGIWESGAQLERGKQTFGGLGRWIHKDALGQT